jgi:hypothetical protein
MARSGSSGRVGRPRKWGPDTPVQQIHLDIAEPIADRWRQAAKARGLTLVDFLTVAANAAIGEAPPLPIQEALPLTAA